MKLSSFQIQDDPVNKTRFGALMADGKTLVSFADAAHALDGKKPRVLAHALAYLEGGEKSRDLAWDILERAENKNRTGPVSAWIQPPFWRPSQGHYPSAIAWLLKNI